MAIGEKRGADRASLAVLHALPDDGLKATRTLRAARATFLLGAAFIVANCTGATISRSALEPGGSPDDLWYRDAQRTLEASLARAPSVGRANNAILFIGDGMGVSTATAARILEGQLRGQPGEENLLSFERFPYSALVKTYSTNEQASESAATATALLAGVKTRSAVIGATEEVTPGDCRSMAGHLVPSLLELAEQAGMATGIVSTARLTHATPAAAYAHTPHRDWEYDLAQPADTRECADIARQLVEFPFGDGLEVALGGGRLMFLPQGAEDPEDGVAGLRGDGRDLTREWVQRYPGSAYVWNSRQLEQTGTEVRHLLGLFDPDHMEFEVDRPADPGGEPSLSEMTRRALEILQENPRGYFLIVEAGRIDHAHHDGNAYRALHETIELSNAVRAAVEVTRAEDTLIVVTADHDSPMSMHGYPTRGNPILGKVVENGADGEPASGYARDALGLPYTTLVYASGPGYSGGSDLQPEGPKRYPHHEAPGQRGIANGRSDLTDVDTAHRDYLQEATVPLDYGSHSGADVVAYASGPGAHLLSGVHEQHYVFHVLHHALRLSHRISHPSR